MLVIEVDGSQHAESHRDIIRDRFLNNAGYSVLRFWNNEVMLNLNGVLEATELTLGGHPSPDLRYAPATLSGAP
ncbi:MAG: putative methylase [Devosia sp.]|nr:putative methylase [Devosia sp.]